MTRAGQGDCLFDFFYSPVRILGVGLNRPKCLSFFFSSISAPLGIARSRETKQRWQSAFTDCVPARLTHGRGAPTARRLPPHAPFPLFLDGRRSRTRRGAERSGGVEVGAPRGTHQGPHLATLENPPFIWLKYLFFIFLKTLFLCLHLLTGMCVIISYFILEKHKVWSWSSSVRTLASRR